MLKTFKYKLNPTTNQIISLNKYFGSVRFVYNYFLNERKKEYETNKQQLNYNKNCKSLTELKKLEQYSWLKEVSAAALQHSLKHLEGAYNNFFKKRASFPKFKSKRDKNSFCIPQYVKLKKDKLIIPKFLDGIKCIIDRPLTGEIRQCTLTRTSTNEYFVSILVETTHIVLPKTNKQVGIDLGIKDFVITSDGFKYKNNKYTKTYAKQLKTAQQHLSRKKRGSNHYEYQRLKVAKIYKKITNSRIDNLHKVSHDLIKNYDIIFVENLNIKSLMQTKLAKHIADVSWGTFISMLTYKALWNEKEIVKIDRFFPSSKTCNCCGYINQNLTLRNREWICPSCNTKLDRDLNAAKNILKEGLKIKSLGINDYRHGDKIRPVLIGIINEVSKVSNFI